MSVGEVSGGADGDAEGAGRFEAELESTEEVRLSWEASGVRWANQWGIDPDTPTRFAATDRRVLFETESGTSSIGYGHVRAVKVDGARDGPDLSMAFVGCGGLCLLVGLLVSTDDLANGAGLVLLSVMLLVAGSAVSDTPDRATVTLIIDNERQRLSFTAGEGVGERLAELASRF